MHFISQIFNQWALQIEGEFKMGNLAKIFQFN